MKGSYTVEASLLMILLVPLLTGIIYLGFSVHNQAWAYGKACEETFKEASLLSEKPQETITKTVRKTMEVPQIALKFLKIQETAEESFTLENKNPAKTVFRIHSLKKLIGGNTS